MDVTVYQRLRPIYSNEGGASRGASRKREETEMAMTARSEIFDRYILLHQEEVVRAMSAAARGDNLAAGMHLAEMHKIHAAFSRELLADIAEMRRDFHQSQEGHE